MSNLDPANPILVLQHIGCETLGIFEEILTANNIPFQYVRAYAGDSVPVEIGTAPALIVMGGPMGVYEADAYPFLKDEMRLIQSAVDAKRPVLGICLGSQLLAATLGAKVEKGTRKEIGWYPVYFSSAAREDALFSQAGDGVMFHWHGDIFNLPEGAVQLVSSDWTPIQGYRYGTNVYGFLFHMEVTEAMIRAWVSEFSKELSDAQIDPESILSQCKRYVPGLNAIGRRIFGKWVELI